MWCFSETWVPGSSSLFLPSTSLAVGEWPSFEQDEVLPGVSFLLHRRWWEITSSKWSHQTLPLHRNGGEWHRANNHIKELGNWNLRIVLSQKTFLAMSGMVTTEMYCFPRCSPSIRWWLTRALLYHMERDHLPGHQIGPRGDGNIKTA